MTFDVTVSGSDIVFPCEPDETVLDAAERAGFSIPYSCRKGVCSTCEGGLIAGELQVRGQGLARGPATGVLLCQARPCSPVKIAPKRIVQRAAPVRKVITTKVHRLTRPNADVVVLHLRFPSGVRAKFQAGQYLKVLMEDGDSRNYSMANAPHESDGVQLHIRHVPGGRFSEGVLAGLEKGDTLNVELPYGEFSLDEEVDHPVILLGNAVAQDPCTCSGGHATATTCTSATCRHYGPGACPGSASPRCFPSPSQAGPAVPVGCTAQFSRITPTWVPIKCMPAVIRS
jgi:CDP-4-dehydro-6-deoxyglucose reductase/3-phenylpropionate/trans-cinnamate dioxygenase ferredoxin reductase subunit